jgi:hypothetical protein
MKVQSFAKFIIFVGLLVCCSFGEGWEWTPPGIPQAVKIIQTDDSLEACKILVNGGEFAFLMTDVGASDMLNLSLQALQNKNPISLLINYGVTIELIISGNHEIIWYCKGVSYPGDSVQK